MKPLPVEFDPSRPVPKELFSRRNWIGWRARQKPGKDKLDKVPVSIRTGSSEGYLLAPQHVGFEEAVRGVRRLKLSGLGFAMTSGCGLIGGDLDRCRDPDTGAIEPWALEILSWRETYFEISPSGQGIRFWAKGDLLHTIKFDPAGVELYASGRFLTFTGLKVDGAPQEIGNAPRTLMTLMERVKAAKAAAGLKDAPEADQPAEGSAEAFKRWAYAQTLFGQINQAAIERLAEWVPTLFPTAEPYQDGFRVKSEDLGRPLEEDISFVSSGIKDFGEHDMGDARAGKRTPIDIVILWHPLIGGDLHDPETIREAAEWLAGELGLPFNPIRGEAADPEEAPIDPDADLWTQWEVALARLRQHAWRPQFVSGGIVPSTHGRISFDPAYSGPVPIRAGITDRLTRSMTSMVAASGNTGKSTYLALEALAIATEKATLLGQMEIDWCGNTLFVSNEESATSVAVRWRGQMQALSLQSSDIRYRLDIWPTDGKQLRLGKLDAKSAVTPTQDGIAFVNALANMAEAGEPVAFIGFDPLISLLDGIGENDATHMNKAVGLLNSIAQAGFIAINVAHHQGKNKDKESPDSFRGSSTIFDTVAEMSTMTALTTEDGAKFGLSPQEARRTLRLIGQRQRDGAIPGVFFFERQLMHLTAEDPRDPEALKLRSTATLKAIPPPAKAVAVREENDLRSTLREEQLTGREIRRGGLKGKSHPDQAWVIMQDLHGWERRRTEAAIVKLLEEGKARMHKVRPPREEPTMFLEVFEPEIVDDEIF